MASLSRKTLDDLKRRHLAFLEQRLASEQARADWSEAFGNAFERILALRIRDMLEPSALSNALGRALTADSVRRFFAPVARDVHRRVLDSLRTNRTSLGDYVPAEARREIDAILERRDLIPAALIRKIFEQKVVIDAVDDTLYDGLMQFNTTVNPFFADWGLPSIVKRMPIGGSLILASMEAMRSEFDRRLEPEIRKFVASFSRRATTELTDAFITRSDEPKFIELRKNIVAFLYSESLADLLSGVDEETADHAAKAAENVVLDQLEHARFVTSLRRFLEDFVEAEGDATIGQWLEAVGATGRPEPEAWAELLWPHVRRAMTSPLVRDYLRKITAEFYDSLEG
ncbi:MAG: hypothetical protein ABR587_10090 [Candidatus Binatia bacterium]